MNMKKLSLTRQILIWFSALILIVIAYVGITLGSMETLWESTVGLYDHPLTTRRAVGEIEKDVLLIHRYMTQLVTEPSVETETIILRIELLEADAYEQVDLLYSSYLGPKSDIDDVQTGLVKWSTIRGETIRLLRSGSIDEARARVQDDGIGGTQAAEVLKSVEDIVLFAKNRADEFYNEAILQRNQIRNQTLLIGAFAVILLIGIGYFLSSGIVPPIRTLTQAAEEMSLGKYRARVPYEATNEIGVLAKAFNTMAETIAWEIEHRDNTFQVSSAMFHANSLRPFCQDLLKNLIQLTDSQLGAIYFLNEEKKLFEPYESIGADPNSLLAFSSTGKAGEFGLALETRSIQHISNIPSDVQLVYSTVSGDYKAKEILTIPIAEDSGVFSVISLASIKSYSLASRRLLDGLVNEMTARLSAIRASQQILEYSERLQSINSELGQQAKELEMQTHELTEQNVELEMQKKQLDEASRLKTNFLSNMSHELRTPLNSVIALSGVLGRKLNGKIPLTEYSYLEIIERNGKNLLDLINDILDISRIEAGREEIETVKFNAAGIIDEVMAMLKATADQKNIEILNRIKDTDLIMTSDPAKLRHILQNLIGNAVKFTGKGYVEVTARNHESHLEIIVTDTGIGIAEEHLPFIFDEFRQADGSTSRKYGGTGLGLAISKKYAHLLGGTIAVKSILDQGSEFTLTLPKVLSVASKEAESDFAEESFANRNFTQAPNKSNSRMTEKTVLLVEDNESAVIQIRDMVEDMGIGVRISNSAAQALQMIDQAIPDAIILDLMMPEVDGFKVLEILRNADATARVPVLILTAKHITKEELKFLKRNNVHQLIQKGDIKYAELQEAIRDMLSPKTTAPRPVVLVVEDNPDNMITVKALLSENHTVLEAVNGYEGIKLAKEHMPDLILMDIALPDISGIEVFKAIRAIRQLEHIPIIALTASAMVQDRETILSYGFDSFVAKPIIAKEFFKEIQEVLYAK